MINTNLTEYYKVMFQDYPDVVSVSQFSKMLGISRHLAYDLIMQKKLKAFVIGNSYKIPKISIINYIFESQEELQKSIGKNLPNFDKNRTEKT